jgi:tetrahydromethanopterin S-methyltransferase subunit B
VVKSNYNRVSGEQTDVTAEFVADISADDVYKNVEKINKQIQELQDSVDYTNATLEVAVPKIESIQI